MAFWPGIDLAVLAEDYLDYQDVEKAPKRQLTLKLEAAQTSVERFTNRQFTPLPALVDGADTAPAVTRSFNTVIGSWTVRVPDLRYVEAETVVSLDGALLTKGMSYQVDPDLDYEPATFIELGEKITTGGNRLSVTGRWGWVVHPPDVTDAVYMLAARRHRERAANYADQVITPEGVGFAYFRQLPATVQGTLDSLRVRNFAVV